MKILNGKEVSQVIKDDVKNKIDKLREEGKRIPKLVVIIVGEDQASQRYVRNKERACEYVGIQSEIIRMSENTLDIELLQKIDLLNNDDSVDGILVQLPLPKHINEQLIIDSISVEKDVDGFNPLNVAGMTLDFDTLLPCTPAGVFELLDYYNYSVEGKHVVVIGKSNIVGKPAAIMAMNRDATVSVCHKKTENIKEICKTADILISAAGVAKLVNSEYIKDGCVIIDVGINMDENNKLCGDVDFKDVESKVEAITPVPGGVGPMTIAMLMKNTLKAYELRE